MDRHTLTLCFLFIETSAMLVYSTWEYSGHNTKMQVRIFKSPQEDLGIYHGRMVWGSIFFSFFELGVQKRLAVSSVSCAD